jgi:3-oxoacyl-[acyl-carrier-protein] synthase II
LTLNAHHLLVPPPDGRSMARAITIALGDTPPHEVQAVVAHGTGTQRNDAAETRALEIVFGSALATVWITSIKASIGHTFAASGLLSIVAGLRALSGGVLPGCQTTQVDPDLEHLRIASTSVRLLPDLPLLVCAQGLGVLNGAVLLRPARP